MSEQRTAAAQAATSPRAAAIVGIIFSVLCIACTVLIRLAVPADPLEPGTWLTQPTYRGWVHLSINLVPFMGIAFLWFMAVLRDRVGGLEDQFFATVFFGSGLLFVALLFGAAALSSGLVSAFEVDSNRLANSEVYAVVRATTYALVNVFAMKMAGVFMFVTSSISLRTAIIPRWVAFAGYGLGAVLLLVITDFEWIVLVFPFWVLLVSVCILAANFQQPAGTAGGTVPAAGHGRARSMHRGQ
jgi:hypothetical protein